MGTPVQIEIIMTVTNIISVDELCNRPDHPPECIYPNECERCKVEKTDCRKECDGQELAP